MSNDDKDDSGKWLAILVELLSNIQDIRPKVAHWCSSQRREENIGAKRGFMSSRYAQKVNSTCRKELNELTIQSLKILESCLDSKTPSRSGSFALEYIHWLGMSIPSIMDSVNVAARLQRVLRVATEMSFDEWMQPGCDSNFQMFMIQLYTKMCRVFASHIDSFDAIATNYIDLALNLFIRQPNSLMTVWSLVQFLEDCDYYDLRRNFLDQNETNRMNFVEAICVCVSSCSHWMRYVALRLGTFLPLLTTLTPTRRAGRCCRRL